jgi:RimJ/RimL family protein N-acetyltransferase
MGEDMRGETLTERLRLVPIGPEHEADLVTVHQDAWINQWYAGAWSDATAAGEFAARCARGWSADGVGKWIAYERATGALVGRGGLSAMPADGAAGEQIARLAGPGWARLRLEVGWAVRAQYRGQGYATEIGRAGLGVGFDVLGADAVIAFTERHNTASRNVMERLGLRFAGEITARGLAEGEDGERDDAPFAVYSTGR